jgi:hypothetical protein
MLARFGCPPGLQRGLQRAGWPAMRVTVPADRPLARSPRRTAHRERPPHAKSARANPRGCISATRWCQPHRTRAASDAHLARPSQHVSSNTFAHPLLFRLPLPPVFAETPRSPSATSTSVKMGKGKGQAAVQFDLATALTKKEGRLIRKAEYMIPYHMARCPAYAWKESEEYFKAEELKEKIAAIEGKAKKRWEANFC